MSGRFASGFVSIVGRPNSGKSTLLNALVGTKLAIVSDKPQTTRASIQGVLNLPDAQVVFLDTPGIHRSDSLFNRRMMRAVREAIEDRDLLLYLADATQPFQREDEEALGAARKTGAPTILLPNKIDRLADKRVLLPLIARYASLMEFAEVIPISALTGEGLDLLRSSILARLPEGPPYFPTDHLTDQPERFLAAEIVREKILAQTRQEVPHSVAVVVEDWERTPGLVRISAAIYVERDGQKAIVIGARGAGLKQAGAAARQELEAMLGSRVFLQLFVKVRPRWRESAEFLNALDYRSMAGTEES